MFDYKILALVASLLLHPTVAVPYVTPPTSNVPQPQLSVSKATEFSAGSEKILSQSPNAAAYSLVDTYDHTNWMSKFTVQNVSLSFALIFVDSYYKKLTTNPDWRSNWWLRELCDAVTSTIRRTLQDHWQPSVHRRG